TVRACGSGGCEQQKDGKGETHGCLLAGRKFRRAGDVSPPASGSHRGTDVPRSPGPRYLLGPCFSRYWRIISTRNLAAGARADRIASSAAGSRPHLMAAASARCFIFSLIVRSSSMSPIENLGGPAFQPAQRQAVLLPQHAVSDVPLHAEDVIRT